MKFGRVDCCMEYRVGPVVGKATDTEFLRTKNGGLGHRGIVEDLCS